MRVKKLLCSILCIAMVLSTMSVSVAADEPTNPVVTNTTTSATYTSLNTALSAASAGDVITINGTITDSIIETRVPVTIKAAENATAVIANKLVVYNFTSTAVDTITVKGITFNDGLASWGAAGQDNSGYNIIVDDCDFIKTTGDHNVLTINAPWNNVTVQNCVFDCTNANIKYAPISVNGGAKKKITVTGNTITGAARGINTVIAEETLVVSNNTISVNDTAANAGASLRGIQLSDDSKSNGKNISFTNNSIVNNDTTTADAIFIHSSVSLPSNVVIDATNTTATNCDLLGSESATATVFNTNTGVQICENAGIVPPVAEVNGAYYATAKAAFQATEGLDSATVTLLSGEYSIADFALTSNVNPYPYAANLNVVANGDVTINLNSETKSYQNGAAYQYFVGGAWYACCESIAFNGIDFVFEDTNTTDSQTMAEIQTYGSKNISYTDCTFDKVSVSPWGDNKAGKTASVTIDGCTFNNIATRSAIHQSKALKLTVTGNDFINVVNGIHISGNELEELTVTDNDFTGIADGSAAIYFGNESWNGVWVGDYSNAIITVTGNTSDAALVRNGNESLTVSHITALSDKTANTFELAFTDNSVDFVAQLGNTYYTTLEAAITAAQKGDTIDLLGNTIEINVSKDNYDQSKNLTFENGTLDLTYAGASTALFWLSGTETLTFNNVNFTKRDIGLDAKFMCYLFNIESTNAVLTFNNCDFNLDGGYIEPQWPGHGIYSSYIANNSGGKIYLTNCDIESEYANFIYQGGAIVENCTYNGYADLDEGDTAGNFLNHNAFPTVIKNSNISTRIFGLRNANGKVEIKDNSYIYTPLFRISNALGEGVEAPVYLDATSTIEAVEMDLTVINDASEGKINSEASAIYVQYKQIDVDENGIDNVEESDKYEIILAGANTAKGKELINELASADLTFDFVGTPVGDGAMHYSVASAKGVTLTQIGDRYMFNYNGVDTYEESGTAIVIGTITIDGYGTYTLGTKDATTNAVYATEIKNNIVDGYTPLADLVINTDLFTDDKMVGNITNGNIAVPTRNLEINVTFPNAVKTDNAKLYQGMQVKIEGGNINKELALGEATYTEDATVLYPATVNVNNNDYVIIADLPYNTTYTVTVSGAGYRTATYSVVLTGDKELTFWNNVMDDDKEIEKDNANSVTKKNFLAGDIVKDNKINIYDLSAVVSYFGQIDLNKTPGGEDFAKYDLDRDGKIDAKDVAYVLVSWGN